VSKFNHITITGIDTDEYQRVVETEEDFIVHFTLSESPPHIWRSFYERITDAEDFDSSLFKRAIAVSGPIASMPENKAQLDAIVETANRQYEQHLKSKLADAPRIAALAEEIAGAAIVATPEPPPEPMPVSASQSTDSYWHYGQLERVQFSFTVDQPLKTRFERFFHKIKLAGYDYQRYELAALIFQRGLNDVIAQFKGNDAEKATATQTQVDGD